MTDQKFRIEVSTGAEQNVLEYHDLSLSQLQTRLNELTKLIAQADWTYIDFDIEKEGDEE